ncbi:MAG TPA: hypothetical protein VD902_02070 [Symbiobacteriaceae bacterium]|nr:hypothetical protein [Symbiobacteriaceae bacterium]
MQYYRARLTHLEAARDEAAKAYAAIRNDPEAGVELRAYASCDLAYVWVHTRMRAPGAREEIQALLDEVEALPVRDSKTASIWDCRQLIHSFDLNWNGVTDCTLKLLELYREYRDPLGVAHSLKLLKENLFLVGDWPQYFAFSQRAPQILAELGDDAAAAYAPLLQHRGILWAGRYAEAEPFVRAELEDVREFKHKERLTGALLHVGYTLGLQRRFAEAEAHFAELLEVHRVRGNTFGRASALGWYGRLKGMAGELETGIAYLRERCEADLTRGNPNGTAEGLVWLGEVLEMQARRYGQTPDGTYALWEAQHTYLHSLGKFASRKHYDCGALAGLMRVHYAQGETEQAETYATSAEQLARPFEYNEYLAAIALTRGHMAWNRGDRGAARGLYRQALIHALRFNRFALDELLGVHNWETPLVPLVPFCLAQGEAGRELLRELLLWWQRETNRTDLDPVSTISPVGLGTSLLAAEQLARRLEPGDGSPQLTVVEQLRAALQ